MSFYSIDSIPPMYDLSMLKEGVDYRYDKDCLLFTTPGSEIVANMAGCNYLGIKFHGATSGSQPRKIIHPLSDALSRIICIEVNYQGQILKFTLTLAYLTSEQGKTIDIRHNSIWFQGGQICCYCAGVVNTYSLDLKLLRTLKIPGYSGKGEITYFFMAPGAIVGIIDSGKEVIRMELSKEMDRVIVQPASLRDELLLRDDVQICSNEHIIFFSKFQSSSGLVYYSTAKALLIEYDNKLPSNPVQEECIVLLKVVM